MPVVAMVRGEKTQLRRICYEMKKEGFNLRAADPPARKAGPLPVRIYGFPKDAGEKAFGGSNYLFTSAHSGRGAWRYLEVGLCFLSYTFRRGAKRRMREEHFVPERLKRLDGPGGSSASKICVDSHSSKLQHRAPLEIRSNLSHIRKTLESGIPVLPSATSLDVVGQWLLCCAGASPTEGPSTSEHAEKFACP